MPSSFNSSLRNLVLLLSLVMGSASLATESDFVLSEHCPPGFEKTGADVCELRTLYQFYQSVQGRGVGGTQTALPEHRDGFSPELIDLGRYLFFDPALSGDGSISCASCHHPDQGLGDGLPRSVGIHDQELSRAAPSLWNVAFLSRFFWCCRFGFCDCLNLGWRWRERDITVKDRRGPSDHIVFHVVHNNTVIFRRQIIHHMADICRIKR